MKTKITLFLSLLIVLLSVSQAHATWVYTAGDLPYIVGSTLTVDAGPDMNLVPPAAGLNVTGTATPVGGATIVSSTWSYIGCTPTCSKPGTVLTPNETNSSTHTTTLANMDGAAVGTHFTYKYSATDSNGVSGSDTMDVIVVAAAGTDLVASYVSPYTAVPGSVTLTGQVSNIGGTVTNNPFTSYFEIQGDPVLSWTSPGITLASGASQNVTASRSFTTGVYKVRMCADGAGTVSETNEGNNCSDWSTLTVAPVGPVGPTATIDANPTAITAGGTTTITWTCSSTAVKCVGANFNTGGLKSGSLVDSPTTTITYTVTATDAAGATDSASVTVTVTGVLPGKPECSDGTDNDHDGKTDFGKDPGCSSPSDNSEDDPKPIYIEPTAGNIPQ